ncbi:hypothetical protein BWQ96_02612 [Gracilariopsis chorda]|uniref:DDE Tnp4 domain-containing protein n=1 Tax=Gracilariopsis chorda TaxID=448386 RepID=A0A2V3J002_9FLOR|nr:hypothetical protein BWQ96_02612 [Gracilariopsis chorda]|eukprot:PXF47633.1 hypothetical protein BWQ96_02612 [Gracilariopsis chorda]
MIFMVRQTDYSIGAARIRVQSCVRHVFLANQLEEDPALLLALWRRFKRAKSDLRNIRDRLHRIRNYTFNINALSEEQCLHDFRFRRNDIGRISRIIGWQLHHTSRNRYQCDAVTAACILFKRLSCTHTWYDMEPMFGMRYSHISEIFWDAIEKFVEYKGHLVTNLQSELLQSRAHIYSEAIRRRGSPLPRCVGFIDCPKIEMCRPGGLASNQRSCFSGHTRKHCLKYLTISTPDGLIFYLYGPEVGRRHDMTVMRRSDIESNMESSLVIEGTQYYVYGDPAFGLRPWLQTAFDRENATEDELKYNCSMNTIRTSVEWNYKDLKQIWTRNAFSRLLRVRQFPVALFYIASALLLNFKTCIEKGGQASYYFDCDAPSFDVYSTL